MPDLDAQLAEQQTKLAELHAAFSTRLDAAAAAHRSECAERDSELNVREKVVTDKMKLLIETDEALKERALDLDKKERAHEQKVAAARALAAAMLSKMEVEAATRASPARVGS